MAIVHVVMKSSSEAPPSAAHAQYIAREGQYLQRGGLELVESGNMPEFAQDDPHSFWVAADTYERKNGRAYTELQIALPRELSPEDRNQLARDAAKELLGARFAYTLAVHTPLAKDNIDQPHMHLMFSERAVDETTRTLSEERFFKRNGAKKDPAWNAREKPLEVREKWVAMMNTAMERAGQEQRLDARSWADQGREDLAALREKKTLRGDGTEAMARHAEIDELRRQRQDLPAPHLDSAAAVLRIEQEAQQAVSRIERWRDEQLHKLDQLIAAAKEKAQAMVESARALVDRGVALVREQIPGASSHQAGPGSFREKLAGLRGNETGEPGAEVKQAKDQEQLQAPSNAARIEQDRAAFRRGFEQWKEDKAAKARKSEEEQKQRELKLERSRAPKHDHGHGRGH